MESLLLWLVLAFAMDVAAQISALSAYSESVDICGQYQDRLWHKFKLPSEWLPAEVEYLSGGLRGPPTCISWGGPDPFRLDAFYECANSAACHRYFNGSSWQPDDGPENPGENLGGQIRGRIAAATSGPGHIDLVALGVNGSYFSNYFDGSWHEWASIGGDFWGEPSIVLLGKQLHVFGISQPQEGKLLHKYFDDGWKPSRFGWEDLSDGRRFVRDVSSTSWGPDRYDIWTLGSDKDLQHKYWQTDAFSEWESLGGRDLSGAPAVVSRRPGTFDVLVSRDTNANQRQYLSKGFFGGRWDPSLLGFYNQSDRFAEQGAVASWSNSTVVYLGVTPENRLVFRTWWGNGWFPDDGSWFELADLAKGKDVGIPQMKV